MIRALQKEARITTLFVTHDQVEAAAVADRIGVMMDGQLQQVGSVQEIYENPADARIARFFGGNNFLPGFKRGQLVETGIGDIEIDASPLADGPVVITVRPEAIEIGANGHNNFLGQVLSCSYHLPTLRCQVHINGVRLNLAPPPYTKLDPDKDVVIHLPRERIRVLPPGEDPGR
jgi:ABC-type Fe3+/spermidine/putrescine transport system ATPase subunit